VISRLARDVRAKLRDKVSDALLSPLQSWAKHRFAVDGRRLIYPALHYWKVADDYQSFLLLNNSYSVFNPASLAPATAFVELYDQSGGAIDARSISIPAGGALTSPVSDWIHGKGEGTISVTLTPPVDFSINRVAQFDASEPHRTASYMAYLIQGNLSYVHSIERAYEGPGLPSGSLERSVLAPIRGSGIEFEPNFSIHTDGLEYIRVILLNTARHRKRLHIKVLINGTTRAVAVKRVAPFGVLSLTFRPEKSDLGKNLRFATVKSSENAKPYFELKQIGYSPTFHHM
jgi:hypothetical protein